MALHPSLRDVLSGLQQERLLDTGVEPHARAALEAHQRTAAASPWFVKALSGFGAWVSTAFLISFFMCVGLWNEEGTMSVLGLVLCAGATVLRRSTQGAFLEQLALAVCLAGSVMVAWGLGESLGMRADTGPALILLVLGSVLLLVFPDAILRFLAAFSVVWAAGYLLWRGLGLLGLELEVLACAVLTHLLFLNQARLRQGRWGELVGPVAFALACWVLAVLLAFCFNDFIRDLRSRGVAPPDALLTLGLTALTLYTVWRVMREQALEPSGVAGAAVFLALVLVAVMTPHTPAVIAAVGMMVLGFHRRSTLLLGLAVAFLLASGAWYYYDLKLTLLAKSLALTGSGLVFLGLRLFLMRGGAPAAAEVR